MGIEIWIDFQLKLINQHHSLNTAKKQSDSWMLLDVILTTQIQSPFASVFSGFAELQLLEANAQAIAGTHGMETHFWLKGDNQLSLMELGIFLPEVLILYKRIL